MARAQDDRPLPEAIDAGAIQLRRRTLADVPDLLAAIESSIDELRSFLTWAGRGVPDRSVFERSVVARDLDFDARRGFEYVLRETSSGELVGEAGGGVGERRDVEIGYWVRSDRTGRGYASAAASALTTMVFDHLPDVERVEIRMDKGNHRSRAVAVGLDFVHVGDEVFDGERLRGQTGEGHIYETSRDRWRGAARRQRDSRRFP